jgi:hypothetical protein
MKMEQVLRERGGVFNTCGQRWNREEQMDETKSQEIGVATMSSTRNSSQPALTSVETFQFEASQTPNCSVQDEEVQCGEVQCGEVQDEEVQCGEVQKNGSFSSSALLGREMFLHAFMAVDYLEFRMTKVKTHFRRKGIFQSSESLGAKTSPRSSRAREDKNFREYVLSGCTRMGLGGAHDNRFSNCDMGSSRTETQCNSQEQPGFNEQHSLSQRSSA